MHMVRHQVPFLNPTPLLQRQSRKQIAQLDPQLSV
jgi:hypothetical protein